MKIIEVSKINESAVKSFISKLKEILNNLTKNQKDNITLIEKIYGTFRENLTNVYPFDLIVRRNKELFGRVINLVYNSIQDDFSMMVSTKNAAMGRWTYSLRRGMYILLTIFQTEEFPWPFNSEETGKILTGFMSQGALTGTLALDYLNATSSVSKPGIKIDNLDTSKVIDSIHKRAFKDFFTAAEKAHILETKASVIVTYILFFVKNQDLENALLNYLKLKNICEYMLDPDESFFASAVRIFNDIKKSTLSFLSERPENIIRKSSGEIEKSFINTVKNYRHDFSEFSNFFDVVKEAFYKVWSGVEVRIFPELLYSLKVEHPVEFLQEVAEKVSLVPEMIRKGENTADIARVFTEQIIAYFIAINTFRTLKELEVSEDAKSNLFELSLSGKIEKQINQIVEKSESYFTEYEKVFHTVGQLIDIITSQGRQIMKEVHKLAKGKIYDVIRQFNRIMITDEKYIGKRIFIEKVIEEIILKEGKKLFTSPALLRSVIDEILKKEKNGESAELYHYLFFVDKYYRTLTSPEEKENFRTFIEKTSGRVINFLSFYKENSEIYGEEVVRNEIAGLYAFLKLQEKLYENHKLSYSYVTYPPTGITFREEDEVIIREFLLLSFLQDPSEVKDVLVQGCTTSTACKYTIPYDFATKAGKVILNFFTEDN